MLLSPPLAVAVLLPWAVAVLSAPWAVATEPVPELAAVAVPFCVRSVSWVDGARLWPGTDELDCDESAEAVHGVATSAAPIPRAPTMALAAARFLMMLLMAVMVFVAFRVVLSAFTGSPLR